VLTFEQPLLLLLLIPVGLLVYFTWRTMSLPYPSRQRLLILISRLALFSFIIAALAGAAWAQPVSRQATVFVGDISSSTNTQRAFIEQWISSALKHKQSDDQVGIVAVGRNALVEQSVKSDINFSHFESTPDTNYTDLAAGLRLAAAILPADSQRHIILLTDGQQNLGDALQEAQLLQQQGIRLDIVPLPTIKGEEARIDGLDAPKELRTNERFVLHIKLYSTVEQTATLHIYLDKTLISQQQVHLVAGQEEISLTLLAPPPGFHTFRVTLDAPHDTLAQNNEAAAFVNVQGPPRVLVVEGQPGSGHNIVAALQATKINVDVATPNDVPTSLDGLVPYGAVVLADVPAVALGTARMQILQSFVRDLGHGLIVSGGQNSYGLGGYSSTPLEETLPVRMDLPQHKETPTIAVVLIIESLEAPLPVNISKEAAKGVVGLLGPNDQVGISAGYGTLSIQMQHVTDKGSINKAIDAMQPEDPPSYIPDFINAEQVLLKTDAKIKHVILLGDGDAFDNYGAQVTKMASEGITVSTVATNADNAEELGVMQQIADWGKGRFYRADDPSVIPQVLLKETERAARRSVVNESFVPGIVGDHPILTGLSPLPSLEGYVATTPKPTAQLVLVSHRDDPVLAVWQYGLGRVVAWTSDALGLWTTHWLSWSDGARWWANLVTWTLPAADSSLTINGRVVNGTGQITIDLPPGTTQSTANQQAQVHIIAPDLSQETITLQPTAPDRWEGNFPASQVGAYLLQVSWQGTPKGNQDGPNRLTATTGLVVPYSPEFLDLGTDIRFLAQLAQAGGGTLFGPDDTAKAFTQSLQPITASIPITFLLLTLAALLLPLDIAARRLSSLEFLTVGFRWLLSHLRPGGAQLATETAGQPPMVTSLGSVRARREERRTRSISLKPPPKPTTETKPVKEAKAAPTPQPTKDSTPKVASTETLLEAKRKRKQPQTDKEK